MEFQLATKAMKLRSARYLIKLNNILITIGFVNRIPLVMLLLIHCGLLTAANCVGLASSGLINIFGPYFGSREIRYGVGGFMNVILNFMGP